MMGIQIQLLILTFIGLSIFGLPADACPRVCQCSKTVEEEGREGLLVSCTGRGITAIPSDIPAESTELRLVDTGLVKLPRSAFSTLRSLKKMHIVNNLKLADIETNSFQGLTSLMELVVSGNPLLGVVRVGLFMGLQNLRSLDLSKNGWTQVVSNMFFGLDQVKSLDLSHNKISNLNEAPFSSPLRQTTHLNLSYNKLKTLSQNAFADWNTLQDLNIRGNLFNVPPSVELEGLESLKSLDVSENPIPYLGPYIFRKLTALETLKINEMSSLSALATNAFAALYNLKEFEFKNNILTQSFTIKHLPSHNKALEYINLSNNTYKSLEGGLFMARPNLTRLALENVPFHCDCKMSWIGEGLGNTTRWQWAHAWTQYNETNATDSASMPPACASPVNFQELNLLLLKQEDFTCDKPSFYNVSADNVTYVNLNDTVNLQVVLHPGLPSAVWFHPRGWFVKGRRGVNATDQDSNFTATEYMNKDRQIVALLSINSVSVLDLGIYTLVATNAGGNSTYQFTLRPDVNGTWPTVAPVINSAPSSMMSPTVIFISMLLMIFTNTKQKFC